MKKKTKELLLPSEYKKEISENCLTDDTKLYEINQSELDCKIQNIELNKREKAKIYGNILGTAKNVIESLEAICHIYYIFLLLDIALNNPKFCKKLLSFDNLDFSDYSYLVKKYGCYKYILPSDELMINKISFNSPGFLEVIGALNPLTQIREYINDRHNRKKDKQFWETELSKSILENQKLELENQKLALQNQEYSIELSFKKVALTKEVYSTLKDAGCSDLELRKFTNECISVLEKLESCIDDNRITEIEIEE